MIHLKNDAIPTLFAKQTIIRPAHFENVNLAGLKHPNMSLSDSTNRPYTFAKQLKRVSLPNTSSAEVPHTTCSPRKKLKLSNNDCSTPTVQLSFLQCGNQPTSTLLSDGGIHKISTLKIKIASQSRRIKQIYRQNRNLRKQVGSLRILTKKLKTQIKFFEKTASSVEVNLS